MLYRAVDTICRYRALFLLTVVIVACGPMAYVLTRKPQYMASAQTQSSTDSVPTGLATLSEGPANGWRNSYIPVAQQNYNRFNDWIQDNQPGGFLDRSLQQANLAHPIDINPRSKDVRLALLLKGLKPTFDSDSVFSITLSWSNAEECEKIVKALQSEYIDEVGNARQRQSLATANFLDNQLTQYKARMRVAEQALIDFKQHNAGQLPEAQTATMSQLSNLKNQLDDLENTSRNSELKKNVLVAQINRLKPTSILEQHIAASPISLEIKDLQVKRSALIVEGWLPTSDRVKAIDDQISVLQRQLAAEGAGQGAVGKNVIETVLQDNPEYNKLTQELTQATIEANTQQAQMEKLRGQIKQYQAAVVEMPSAEASLNDRTRDYTILKSQYEDLLKRREQARITTQLDKVAATSTLHPIGVVYAERTTTRTKTALMLIGMFVLSLVAGIAVTLFAEWADPTLRNTGDLERRLGIAVLAGVPEIASWNHVDGPRGIGAAITQRMLPRGDYDR